MQGFLDSELDVVWMVESVPKLRDDEEIAALGLTGCKHSAQSFTGLLFVAIVACAVKKAIACFNGVNDCISADILRHLPKTEADLGHQITTLKNKVCLALGNILEALSNRSKDSADAIEGLS